MPLAPSKGFIMTVEPSESTTLSARPETLPITISSCPTASKIRHARRGCLIAHQRRRPIKVLAKVKLTISQTTPRTAIQLSRATRTIIYQTSCCPASSIKVNTAATVRLGSRKGLIKSTMRQNHLRSVFAFNLQLLSAVPLPLLLSGKRLISKQTQAPSSLSHRQGGLRFAEPISSFYCISGIIYRTPTLIQEKHALLRRIQNISNRMDIYSPIITHLRRIVVYVGLFRYHCTRKGVLSGAISTVAPGHMYFC